MSIGSKYLISLIGLEFLNWNRIICHFKIRKLGPSHKRGCLGRSRHSYSLVPVCLPQAAFSPLPIPLHQTSHTSHLELPEMRVGWEARLFNSTYRLLQELQYFQHPSPKSMTLLKRKSIEIERIKWKNEHSKILGNSLKNESPRKTCSYLYL